MSNGTVVTRNIGARPLRWWYRVRGRVRKSCGCYAGTGEWCESCTKRLP